MLLVLPADYTLPAALEALETQMLRYIANLEKVLLEMLPGNSPKCSERTDATAGGGAGSEAVGAVGARGRQAGSPLESSTKLPSPVRSTTTWMGMIALGRKH